MLDAYEQSAKAGNIGQREAADAAGKSAALDIAVDTLHVLHRIADALERIADDRGKSLL